ncbi:MAG: helix-turn-helix transcriptional regulator [Caldilineaceae bacterium]|nr:helix-turn-helix transcriptional regulator [Caldilineaceae bacterium]MCB0094226.1 helix-turn-helix transcriptional regulator [Caldilineaceae bacterium]
MLEQNLAFQVAELFSALSDASRVRIISALAKHEMNVGDLSKATGLGESAVSHHLRHLRQMRLVRTRREGRYVFYALHDDHVVQLFEYGLMHVQHD